MKKVKLSKTKLNPHLGELELAEYVEFMLAEKLNEAEKEVLIHVENCDKCRNAVVELYAFLETEQPEAVKEKLKTQNQPAKLSRFGLIAAAFLIIPVMFIGFWQFKGIGIDQTLFAVNPAMEYMVGEQFRSGGLEITAPAIGAEFQTGQVIIFRWQGGAQSGLWLYILSNSNETLFSAEVVDNDYFLPMKLNPGLYYWQLEDAEDIFFVGKFSVN